MKFSITKSFKIFLIIALSLVVVGMVFLGIFGFNKTADYGAGYEVKVHVNQYTPTGNTIEVAKNATEVYFVENGIKSLAYTQRAEGTGLDLIYKFGGDVSEKCAGLAAAVQNALDTDAEVVGLTATAEVYATDAAVNSQFGWILLAVGIATVVFFVYLLFAAKFAQAVSVVCSAVVSAILYISLISIARVPVYPTGAIIGVFAFVLSAVLSVVMASRYKEIAKLNEDMSAKEIADEAARKSLLRFILIGALIALASLIFIGVGPAYVRFIGVQILLADVAALFASYAFTPTVFSVLKKSNKR
ncbi:MAG: hypothetical protein J5697_04540 [Clostridia bacterium]|nr:hypothetical protein [Clostridia bacterium]